MSASGVMRFCVTHMAPQVWTGGDDCIYRASWTRSYPEPCDFQLMLYSFHKSQNVEDAATEVPRGFTRCDECEGRGWFWADCCADCGNKDPCPSCSGSGLVPTEKLREAVILAIRHYPSQRPTVPTLADAVLAKVAEHIGEER